MQRDLYFLANRGRHEELAIPATPVSASHPATNGRRRRLVTVERPGVPPEGVFLEPAFERGAMNADEVAADAADDGKARFVRPLVEDLLTHLGQLGRRARVSNSGTSARQSGRTRSRSSALIRFWRCVFVS